MSGSTDRDALQEDQSGQHVWPAGTTASSEPAAFYPDQHGFPTDRPNPPQPTSPNWGRRVGCPGSTRPPGFPDDSDYPKYPTIPNYPQFPNHHGSPNFPGEVGPPGAMAPRDHPGPPRVTGPRGQAGASGSPGAFGSAGRLSQSQTRPASTSCNPKHI